MKKFILIITALTIGAIVASSSIAAQSKPTLVVTPSQPQVGDFMTFVGCGFNPNGGSVTVLDNQPGKNLDSITITPNDPFNPFVKADGCFDTTNFLFTQAFQAGTYKVTASQDHAKVTLTITVS